MDEIKRSTRPKSKELKIFQTLQKNIAAIGFAANMQKQTKYRKISRYQSIMITILSMDLSTLCVFFYHEANGIEKYMDVIYQFTAGSGIFISFVSIIFRNDDIFNMLEHTQNELNDSKYPLLIHKTLGHLRIGNSLVRIN